MDEQAVAAESATEPGQDSLTFQSVRFGEVTIQRERILSFPRGLIGFPGAQDFVFLHQEEGKGPFFWLQSVTDPGLAFVVTEPQHFFPEYRVPLTREEQAFLEISSADDGVVCLILVVPEDSSQITANLRGPLVVNVETRRGMQLVLQGDEFPTKALLFARSEEGDAQCSS